MFGLRDVVCASQNMNTNSMTLHFEGREQVSRAELAIMYGRGK